MRMKLNLSRRINKKSQKGLSMIELGLVFSVIAVAIAALLYAYGSVQRSYNMQQVNEQIQMIGAAENGYLLEQHTGTPDSIQDLYNKGYTDYDFSQGGISPFGTNFSVNSSSDNTDFYVNVDASQDKNCTRLVQEWNNSTSGTTAYCDNSSTGSKGSSGTNGSILHVLYNPNSQLS
ncbi:type II secretion system protein [Fangia hongkongensis]|uniref:type II secretion system protein n=1 Tax=Fangia hongkongensis TaxID=270495 RepID=UPI0003674AA3|nr:type II secretion system protein [Fangia hongkongensis]MBK2124006.1 type II secretion system protein [Fangia hongkongensis]